MEQKEKCWLCGNELDDVIVKKLGIPIEVLSLSKPVVNCLHRRDIFTVEQLVKMDKNAVLRLYQMGKVKFAELKQKVNAFGFDCWN